MRERLGRKRWLSCGMLGLALSVKLSACHLATEGTGLLVDDDPIRVDGDDQGDDESPAGGPSGSDADPPASAEPEDASSRPGPRGRNDAGAAAVRDAGAAPSDCARAGSFALRMDFAVNWQGTSIIGIVPVLAPGAGELAMFASVTFADDGFRGPGQVKPCGAVIPDFEAGQNLFLGEVYGAYFPEPSWDASSMPTWPMRWQAACTQPGCAFSTDLLQALLGTRTRERAGRPMQPGMGRAMDDVDHDGDGAPGMTLLTREPFEQTPTGRVYAKPPLGALINRAEKLMLAIALQGRFEGKFESCERLSGKLLAGSVETSAVGCTQRLAGGAEAPCDASSLQFLDENLPVWSVHDAAFKAVRIADRSCSNVRAAFR